MAVQTNRRRNCEIFSETKSSSKNVASVRKTDIELFPPATRKKRKVVGHDEKRITGPLNPRVTHLGEGGGGRATSTQKWTGEKRDWTVKENRSTSSWGLAKGETYRGEKGTYEEK